LGTSAVKNPELVKQALKTFEDSVVIGIDAKDGMVAIEGWAKTSEFTAIGFAKKMEELGAKNHNIYGHIQRRNVGGSESKSHGGNGESRKY